MKEPQEFQKLHDLDTEKIILGSFLIDQNLLDASKLTGDIFYLTRHQKIYKTMHQLHKAGGAVDNITLAAELKKDGSFDEIGGDAFITELIVAASTGAIYNLESYENILIDKANRRKCLRIANSLATAASDETKNVHDAIPTVINSLSNLTITDNSIISIQDLMSEAYDEISYHYQNPQEVWGVKTGFPSFDFTTGGLQKGELLLVSGMPKVGKSMWVMQAGLQMSREHKGVIFSLEMRRMAVAMRWISGMSSVDSRALKSGRLEGDDFTKITSTVDKISAKSQLWMCDRPRMKLSEYRAQVANMKARYGIEWVVLDYLYLLDAGSLDDNEKTTMISQELKRISREFDVASIVIHSINKSGMDKINNGAENLNGALRGSAQSEYDCDIAVFLKDYDPKQDKDSWKIKEADRANIKDMVFGYARDLKGSRQWIRFVKNPNFPFFAEYQEGA